jgi:phosphonate transport system ATP-binding protein
MKNFGNTTKDVEVVITTQDMGVIYPNGTIGLHPISLELFSDQITVLLGTSGAGKSTLLKSLNLLVKPTTGTVEVNGIGILTQESDIRGHRRNTGMIFQQHQLIGRLTVLENVLMGRIGHYPAWRSIFSLNKKERQWALECLDRVSLQHKALSRCDALSGGQQQRVGIARAIAQRPNLILADEPIASLDPAASLRVLSMLRLICKQDKIPAIISLHQLEFARQVADRIIGLSEGKVLFDGRPKELNNDVVNQIYGVVKTPEPSMPTDPNFLSGDSSQQLH